MASSSVPHSPSELPSGPDRWGNQNILFCGHFGYFVGDVIITPFAVTVFSKKPVTPDKLKRKNLDEACWHITDAYGGYWNAFEGIFVLPRKSLTEVTDDNRAQFIV